MGGYDGEILHVLWALESGGAPVYQLVHEQRRRGIEADVLVGSRSGHYGALAREAGATVHELGQRSARDAVAARRARAIFDAYPIVHFHAPEPLLIASAAAEPRAGLFYTHRGGNRHYPLRKRMRHKLIGRHLRRRFSGFSANTRQSAQAAAHIYGLPIEAVKIVYNGLDYSLLEPRRPPHAVLAELGEAGYGTVRLGTAAILRDLKRIDRLITATAHLHDPSLRTFVFGDGVAREELERQASELDVAPAVTFTGHCQHIGDYLQVLDIFVLPSGPQEAFGNAAVEAMALGIPTIVFADGGGLTEHIDDGTDGFIVRDQAHLEARLRELIADDALRGRIGDAGRRKVRSRYTLAAMAAGYAELYSGVRADDAVLSAS